MSTEMSEKTNGCYTISATRFYGGIQSGLSARIEISDGKHIIGIALTKKEAIDFCATIISMMNELGR